MKVHCVVLISLDKIGWNIRHSCRLVVRRQMVSAVSMSNGCQQQQQQWRTGGGGTFPVGSQGEKDFSF